MQRWDELDRYLIITSDAHAGATMVDYKPYLERRWHDEFDAWVAGIRNPWADLVSDQAKCNWDSDARLNAMDADGIVGEVIFPNTLPPFFDILAHLTGVPRDPDTLERKWVGLQAHNRWLADFCSEAPLRRKGIFQLLPNDIEAALDEIKWIAGTGVAAGVMLPAIPPNHAVAPYFSARYDALWAACAEAQLPVHQHQGTGAPDVEEGDELGFTIFFTELDLWTKRTLHHLIVGGVFERHPELQFVWTEMWGLRWAVDELERMTRRLKNVQSRFADDPNTLNYAQTFGSKVTDGLSLTPVEYWVRNCSLGASMLPRHEVRYRHVLGVDRILWGTDFPHPEGSAPWSLDALRVTLFDVPVDECRAMLGGNAGRLYHFDLDALAPVAAAIGPRIEDVHTPFENPPRHTGEAFAAEEPLEILLR
jgi:predicted TIM-barrel fold metal-dependent hydrolase